MIATYPQPARSAWLWAASPHEARRPTIVMIEDDSGIAEMYRLQLALDGFRVLIAGDGVRGLELVRSTHPDLVLLDLLLPEMEGFTVLQRMRAEPTLATTPVIVLSNFSEPDMMRRGRDEGAVDYLIKSSTTPAALSARVRRWLTSRTDD